MRRVFKIRQSYSTIFIHQASLDGLHRLALPLPVIDVLHNNSGSRLGGILSANALNEVVVGVY